MDYDYTLRFQRFIYLNGRVLLEKTTATLSYDHPEYTVNVTFHEGSTKIGAARAEVNALGKVSIKLLKGARAMDGWAPPTRKRMEELHVKAFQNKEEPLPHHLNAVTAIMYRRNGALMCQQRSDVNQHGDAILEPGLRSLHGGNMKTDDPVKDILREIAGEFGVKLTENKLAYLGKVYDAHVGRQNYIYQVIPSYEDALLDTHGGNVEAIMKAILDCEGLGRLNMTELHILKSLENGAFTDASATILKAFPAIITGQARKAA